jgi:FAD/FMN-containing dehydrogenase
VDLSAFADAVGAEEPVRVVGGRTDWDVGGAPVPDVREVRAPAGIVEHHPDEMIVRCGAGTPVAELGDALATHGQFVTLPARPGATVGGVLAVGRSGIMRLGHGPVRDTVLEVRAVDARGRLVRAGAPVVKNVTGYDLCRLVVGSLGTLALVAEVVLRCRPLPRVSRWFAGETDPFALLRHLHRPASVLWDGTSTWLCLEGHADDVAGQARAVGLPEVGGPPALPTGGRRSVPPSMLPAMDPTDGRFIAEIGVGVVHTEYPTEPDALRPEVLALNQAVKARFDPTGRLNPGRLPWRAA